MIDSFRNIFAIPDLRKRVFFTFALLAVYRMGSFIPIPGIDPVAIAEFTKAAEGTVLGFLNLFSGGALGRMTVFALGIMPYISASIILQLLTVVWPYLEKLVEGGRARSSQDHPVHAIRHDRAVGDPVDGNLVLPRADHRARRCAAGARTLPGLGFSSLDGVDADDRDRLRDVAR